MQFKCDYCGAISTKPSGHVNRSRKQLAKLFCNKKCFGLSRRKNKSRQEKIEEKRLYDIARRDRIGEELKAKKREYYRRTYDQQKAAVYRKARMHYHIEYCRRPEYKDKKRQYDKKHRADKMFGPFADAFLLLEQIDNEIAARATKYEIGLANGTINKARKRRRAHDAFNSGRP